MSLFIFLFLFGHGVKGIGKEIIKKHCFEKYFLSQTAFFFFFFFFGYDKVHLESKIGHDVIIVDFFFNHIVQLIMFI